MSLPPNASDNTTAHFMMDGILHNLARKQRYRARQPLSKRPREASPTSPSRERVSFLEDDLSKIFVNNSSASRPREFPLKGILKRVHFPVELGPQNLQDYQPLDVSTAAPAQANDNYSQTITSPQPAFLPHPAPPPPPPQLHHPSNLPPPPAEGPLPPSLFRREIEVDEYLSESAFKLYTKFIDELAEFVDQQGEVIKRRLAVQEKREILRRLREEVSQCDAALIDHVRQCMTTRITSEDSRLIALFDAAQAARDQVGPVEAEYEPQEIDLGAEEYKLKEKYANIEGRFEHFFRLNANPSSHHSIPSHIQYEEGSSSSSASGEKDDQALELPDGLFHGAFIGDQVGIGQEPLRAEGLPDEAIDRHKKRMRERRRPTLSSDTGDRSRKQRSNATSEDRAQDELLADLVGIMGANKFDLTSSQELETRDRRISQTLKGVDFLSLFAMSGDFEPFPNDLPLAPEIRDGDGLLLLCEPASHEEYFTVFKRTQLPLTDYLVSFSSTPDRVSRWILHQLRLSRREMYALRREITENVPYVTNWSDLVLSEWSNDFLGHGQSYHLGSIEDDNGSSIAAAHHIISHADVSFPQAEPDASYRPQSSCLSNAALIPTISDLHSRFTSTPQERDILDSTVGDTGFV